MGCPGIGFTRASCIAYSIMNGVMTDGVSAGSNQVGASEMCTAHVSSPSGAATAGAATRRAARATARTLMSSPPRDQAPEHGAVRKAIALGVRRRAFLQPLADRLAARHVEAGHLALVAHEGGDLAVDRLRDVDDDVRLVRAPVPELADLVRRQPRLAVIAVLEVADAVGVVHEDRVRPVLPDGPHDVAEELARVLEEAVGVAEHHHVLDAHEVGGGALLVGPSGRERGRRERALGGAGIAVGAQHVRDLAAGGDPFGDDAARADLGVVGMREDHHRPLGDVAHDLELPGLAWHDAHSTGGSEYTLGLGKAGTPTLRRRRWLTC